jgi:hypothetical protein
VRNGLKRAFRAATTEELRIRAVRGAIVVLFCVAVVTAVVTSWNGKPHFEIIVEACSFLGAVLIVVAQHGAERRALRARALRNVLQELTANARRLAGGEFIRTPAELAVAMTDHTDGIRYYYSHLDTTATRSAILAGALDGRRDEGLLQHLTHWVSECEACNRRFLMSELRLFSSAGDLAGVQERMRIHVSIATGPAVQQRAALARTARFLLACNDERALPKRLSPLFAQLSDALQRFREADRIARRLHIEIQLAGRTQTEADAQPARTAVSTAGPNRPRTGDPPNTTS